MDEQQVREGLWAWRRAHPRATFDEIDAEVQRQFAGLQAGMVAELSAPAGATPSRGPEPEEAAYRCPQCQALMQRRGSRRRRVPTRQGAEVELERAYYVCPACGAGVFPPR